MANPNRQKKVSNENHVPMVRRSWQVPLVQVCPYGWFALPKILARDSSFIRKHSLKKYGPREGAFRNDVATIDGGGAGGQKLAVSVTGRF